MRYMSWVCLALLACDDGGSGGMGGAGGVGGAGGMGGAGGGGGGASVMRIAVEEDGVIIPVTNGATVNFEWGFQGGTMIRPAVLLPAEAVAGLDEVRLTMRHRPDPDHPADFGEAGNFLEVILDLPVEPHDADFRRVGPVDQQLGWTDLDGMRLELVAQVTAPGLDAQSTVRLAIEGETGPCDAFPTSGEGCRYADVPGRFVIDAIEPGGCEGAVRLTGLFGAVDNDGIICVNSSPFSSEASRSVVVFESADAECLEQQGVQRGTQVDGTLSIILTGTCSPVSAQLDDALAACRVDCF